MASYSPAMAAVRRSISSATAAAKLPPPPAMASHSPAMAGVRRTISSAAAAGRYGLGSLGSRVTLQDLRLPPMATLFNRISSTSAAAKFGFGPLGLQTRSYSTGSMPKWMMQHQQAALNPELAFRKLSPQDKDLVVLMYLLMSEGTEQVYQFHVEDLKVILKQFAKLALKQEEFEQGLWSVVGLLAVGGCFMAYAFKEAKRESTLIVGNLASHSGDIMAALVDALKHGVGSKLLGKGKRLEMNPDWWEKRKEKKPEDVEAEAEQGWRYGSPYFSKPKPKPEDKQKHEDKRN